MKTFLQCTKKKHRFAAPVKSNPRKSTIIDRPPLESQFPDRKEMKLKLINKLRNLFKCLSSFYQKFFGFRAASVQSIIPKVTGVYLNIYICFEVCHWLLTILFWILHVKFRCCLLSNETSSEMSVLTSSHPSAVCVLTSQCIQYETGQLKTD